MAEPGYVIWKAWRDGMLAQGREVAPERMAWETLDQRDRDLDAGIESAARSREGALVRRQEDAAARLIHPFVCGASDGPGVPECLRQARAALAPEPPSETVWLIERGQSMGQQPTVWWTGIDWSADAFEATRYSSREKAEAYIEAHSGFGIPSHGGPVGSRFGVAVEHAFIEPRERKTDD